MTTIAPSTAVEWRIIALVSSALTNRQALGTRRRNVVAAASRIARIGGRSGSR
jgi:hypothetical protein